MVDVEGKFPILIVEDHPKMLELLMTLVKSVGFTSVSKALSGPEALKFIQDNPVELILCDYHMKPMNGLELRKELQESAESDQIPFILVTADTEFDLMVQAAEASIEVLVKPFAAETLMKKMAALLGNDALESVA